MSLAKGSMLRTLAMLSFVLGAAPAGAQQGTVPAREAIARLEAHDAAIFERQEAVDVKYDYYPAPATLLAAFRVKGVDPATADGLARNWGQNTLFLNWTNIVEKYYSRHREALRATIDAIREARAESVPAADLARFDEGMAAWLEHERTVLPSLAEGDAILASRAMLLGQASLAGKAGDSAGAERARAQAATYDRAYTDYVDVVLRSFAEKTFFTAGDLGAPQRKATPCREVRVENRAAVVFDDVTPYEPGEDR